jgi:hypothetical protein
MVRPLDTNTESERITVTTPEPKWIDGHCPPGEMCTTGPHGAGQSGGHFVCPKGWKVDDSNFDAPFCVTGNDFRSDERGPMTPASREQRGSRLQSGAVAGAAPAKEGHNGEDGI